MKKIVNLRVPAALCLCLIAGIAAGYAAYRADVSWVYLLAVAPVCCAVFIALTIFSRNAKYILLFALSSVFLFTGIIYGSLVFQNRSQITAPYGENYVSGVVETLAIGDDGRQIILKEVSVGGVKLDGKLLANLSSTAGELCDEGDTVGFYAEISAYDLITYGKVNSHITDGVYYYCSVYEGLTAERGFSLFGSVRSVIRSRLYESLDDSSAGVIYAMLTGDSEGIEDGIISSFRYGGISHIFAVSGLHIGVIYGALLGFCSIIKRRGMVSSLVCLAVIVLYSGICGFTVSSVRAVIMCSVGAFSRLVGVKYDMLNSLSAAVILILLINPLDLFSYGFRLSVSAVLGIALFSAVFRRRLNFLPKKTGEGLAVSLSAQIGTLPAMLSSFGYVSGAGLVLNLVIIPVLSVLFVALIIGVALSVIIFPLAQTIIYVAALPLEAVLSFITAFGFEEALLCGVGGTVFTVVYYVFMAALSDKLNRTKLQTLILACFAVVTAAIYAFAAAHYPINGTFISVSANYGGGYVLFKTESGSALVITENVATYNLRVFLSSCGEKSADVLVILGGESCAGFIYNLDIAYNRAYVCAGYLTTGSDGKTVTAAQSFTEFGIGFTYIDGYTLVADCNGVRTGICGGDVIAENCDLLIGDAAFYDSAEAEGAYTVNFSSGSGEHCVYSGGDKKFVARSGALRGGILF